MTERTIVRAACGLAGRGTVRIYEGWGLNAGVGVRFYTEDHE